MAKDWTPTQKWLGGIAASALLAFACFVGIGATKGIGASEDVCRIEKKVDEQVAKEAKNAERYGRIEALLESMKEKIDQLDQKLDRRR